MNVYYDESTNGHPCACWQISTDHLNNISNLAVAFFHIALGKRRNGKQNQYINYIKLGSFKFLWFYSVSFQKKTTPHRQSVILNSFSYFFGPKYGGGANDNLPRPLQYPLLPRHLNTSIPQYRSDFYIVNVFIVLLLGKDKLYRNFNNMISWCYITIIFIKYSLQML